MPIMKPNSKLPRIVAVALVLVTPVLAGNLYWDGGTTDIATTFSYTRGRKTLGKIRGLATMIVMSRESHAKLFLPKGGGVLGVWGGQ